MADLNDQVKIVRSGVGRLAIHLPIKTASRVYYQQGIDYFFVLEVTDVDDDYSAILVTPARKPLFCVNMPRLDHSIELNLLLCRMMNTDTAGYLFNTEKEWFASLPGMQSNVNRSLDERFYEDSVNCDDAAGGEFLVKPSLSLGVRYPQIDRDLREIETPNVVVHSNSAWQAVVSWGISKISRPADDWLIVVTSLNDSNVSYQFIVDGKHPLSLPSGLLTAGNTYGISVCGLLKWICAADYTRFKYLKAQETVVQHRAIYRASDLENLLQRAILYASHSPFVQANWLYRNKSVEYFADIELNNNGIMEPYLKDPSGDPASPINGMLSGLFFMSTPERDGRPPRTSPFGPRRIQVPSGVLLEHAPVLYFADFYCMLGTTHYITVVMCRPNSAADFFCSNHGLPRLQLYGTEANPFIYWDDRGVFVNNTPRLQVEMFYTESIDIPYLLYERGARMSFVDTICQGSSKPGGIPKNPECCICNLPRPKKAAKIELNRLDFHDNYF